MAELADGNITRAEFDERLEIEYVLEKVPFQL